MLRVNLTIGLDSRHVRLRSWVEKGNCTLGAIGASGQVNRGIRYEHVVGAGQPGVRVVMQVVVVAKAIDVGPSLWMSVNGVIDNTVIDIANDNMIDAVAQPYQYRAIHGQQIFLKIARCQISAFVIQACDLIDQRLSCGLIRWQAVTHKHGWSQ